jgi:ketosteroid isomerase-like protein
MSQENVEIAGRALAAYNWRDVDSIALYVTTDFEWFPALPGTVEGVALDGYRGREGIETYLGEIGDTWEKLRVLGDEFRDLGDRVLVLGRVKGRGRGSGVEVEAPLAIIFDFRDGKMSRSKAYLDHDEALRAAGLAE